MNPFNIHQRKEIITIGEAKAYLQEAKEKVPISLISLIDAQLLLIDYVENEKSLDENHTILNRLLSLVKTSKSSVHTGFNEDSILKISNLLFENYIAILMLKHFYLRLHPNKEKDATILQKIKTEAAEGIARMLHTFLIEINESKIKINHLGLTRGFILTFLMKYDDLPFMNDIYKINSFADKTIDILRDNHKIIGRSTIIHDFINTFKRQVYRDKVDELERRQKGFEIEDEKEYAKRKEKDETNANTAAFFLCCDGSCWDCSFLHNGQRFCI